VQTITTSSDKVNIETPSSPPLWASSLFRPAMPENIFERYDREQREKQLSKKRAEKEAKKKFYLDEVNSAISARPAPACIRSITEQDVSVKKQLFGMFDNSISHRLNIFPGRVDIRTGSITGSGNQGEEKKRSVISHFSRKSRRNMFKIFGQINETFEMWQTFTFSDDVLEGLTENERNEFAATQLHRFSVWVQREYASIGMFWRKELEERKTGKLKGSKVPHYHLMYYVPGVKTEEEYTRIARVIGSNWVRLTGSINPAAYAVAIHKKSYERIDSRKKAIAYIGKYMAKPDISIKGENDRIGRMWGYFGNITMALGEAVTVTADEMVLMKRMLRRYAKRSKRMKKALGKWACNTFLMCPGAMIWKLLGWITGESYNGDYGGLASEIPF